MDDERTGSVALTPALAKLRGFTQIPNAILRSRTLSDRAKLTYAVLLSYAWQEDHCFPGQARMASDLGGVCLDTVQRALNELRDVGLIAWKRKGQPPRNHYVILEIPASFDAAQLRLPTCPNAAPERHSNAAPVTHEEYTVEEDSVPVSSASLRKPRKPPPPVAEAAPKVPRQSSDTEELIKAFAAEHEHVLKTPYMIEWARDGQRAKRAIETYGLAACVSAVTAYFRDTRSLTAVGADIPKFVGRIPTLGGNGRVSPKTAGNAAAVQAFIDKGRKS